MRKFVLVLGCLVMPAVAPAQAPTTDVHAAFARLRPSDTLRYWATGPSYSGQKAMVVRIAGDTLVVRDDEARASAIHAPRFDRIDIGHLRRRNEGQVFGSGGKGMLKGLVIGAGIGAVIGALTPASEHDRGDQSGFRIMIGGAGGAILGSVAGFITGTVRGSNPYLSWEQVYRRP